MPLGTLDRTPPPFFKQGPSALSKLMFFGALALFLMVADTRFRITEPLRAAVATVIYPAQWLVLQPVLLAREGAGYFESLKAAQQDEAAARRKLALQSLRASQVEQLELENQRLRQLLELRARTTTPSQAAEVLYDAADPYSRKIIVDKGMAQGVQAGSPVLDDSGVLGQVTRVLPLLSEVTLVTDRDQAIPVLDARSGVRGVAFGEPSQAGMMELRFMPVNADLQPGDLLTTSGIDGIYPPGLPVAKIAKVERHADSTFARVELRPEARVNSTRDVLLLAPVAVHVPQQLEPIEKPAAQRKGGKGHKKK
jgi:rod shape-determining protein MreC